MIFCGVAMLFQSTPVLAIPIDHYAVNSKLSTGRWARVKVTQTGMHLISNTELQNMGFTDPSRVKVYGTGGRRITEALSTTTPDDLPEVSSIHTDKGIVFFAVDQFSWSPSTRDGRPYAHTIHAYSDDNYYFISDIESSMTTGKSEWTVSAGGGKVLTEFTARLIHEKELEPAGESGAQIYGEDFRSTRSQTFNLKLTDRVPQTDALVYVRFGAKTTNGSSSLAFKANGAALPTSSTDRISSSSSSSFASTTETSKTITAQGESVDLGIEYSQTGVLFKARLDYIETFYTRHLALNNGELYFYGTYEAGMTPTISGCTAQTVIWDVTDPASPKVVEYTLTGDKASFALTRAGYREFVAFNPSSVSTQAKGDGMVANQDIHGMEIPDMVIITFPAYRQGAERIARMHETLDGFRVAVVDANEIYNEFSGGKSDPGAFRRLLKMWYDRGVSDDGHRLRYCLLMGKPSFDHKMLTGTLKNAGYTPMPIYQSYEGLNDETSYSCDDYIGMIDDVEEGKFKISTSAVRVSIGRLPVTNADEANRMAIKIENYALNPDPGIWRNRVMIIADDDDNGAHLRQAESGYELMSSKGNGGSFIYDRIYLDSYKRVLSSVGPTYPQATERMLRNYNDGVLLTGYIGHASETNWGHEHLWEWESITSMHNRNLTFMYAATCSFAYWDKAAFSGGEELMLNPDGGVIAMISASRKVYIDRNGYMTNAVLQRMFQYDEEGEAARMGDIYREGRNTQLIDNSLRYLFMGDPALRIPNPTRNVYFTRINDIDTESSADKLPEIAARSTVTIEGDIRKNDGSIDTEFNGTVNLQLYDGERVITTYGQGTSGVVMSYNDRDKRLAMTTAKVQEGKWTAMMHVPPEIQGTYTTAMIAAYAWDERNLEANGITTQLYVYGYDGNDEDDTEGPVIEYFYVNTPNFENGGIVSPNAMLIARMKDESGINISDTGIGHSLMLTVDNNEIYNDLNTYFIIDPEDGKAGLLAYPMSGLTGGKHSLTLSVWDNANNVSKSTIYVNVGAAIDPVIYGITASTHDTSVDFHIDLDRPNTALNCTVGIYDLNGRRIWDLEKNLTSDMQSRITTSWDMCDAAGTRVSRGIYIYRVTVETPEGTYSSKSKKIAISAAQ